MVKKIALFSLAFLICYEVFLRCVSIDFPTGHHQWNQNVIKIEKYLFENKDYKYVLLGSSLSFSLLEKNSISLYNMSFAGYSIHEGFALLKKSNKIPDTILVEMNMALREEDTKFTQPFFSFYSFFFKKNFYLFRTQYQPCSVLTGFMRKNAESSSAHAVDISEESPIFQKLLGIQIKEYSKKMEISKVEKIFAKLKENIESLEKSGKKIVFFEMPFHKKLHTLDKQKILKEYFQKYFPSEKYSYFYPDREYKTTDGIHLSSKELAIYGHAIEERIRQSIR